MQGRAADVLAFPTGRGDQVTLVPLVFGALVEPTPAVELFQTYVAGIDPDVESCRPHRRACVCACVAAGADPDSVWQAVSSEITHLLIEHKLERVTLERGKEPPEQSSGGKYREIIPLN